MLHIVVSYGFQVQIGWRQAGCRLLPDHLEACLLPDCTFGFSAPPLGYLMWKVLINTSLACKRSRSLSVSNIVILLALFWSCWGAGLRRLSLWLKLHPGSCFQAGRECQINLMNLCINSIRKICVLRSAWNPRNLSFSSCTLLFIPSVCPKVSLFLISHLVFSPVTLHINFQASFFYFLKTHLYPAF